MRIRVFTTRCARVGSSAPLRAFGARCVAADPAVVAELLADAWRRKAPTTLRTHGPAAG
jgi:hypothetical protein